MTGWIRSTISFPHHSVVFYLTHRDPHFAELAAAFRDTDDATKAEGMEFLCRKVIEMARPELAGCMVHFFQLDFRAWQFEILASHPSLPPAADGAESERVHLWVNRSAKQSATIGKLK